MNRELEDLFKYYLPNLDKAYAKSGVPLTARPLRAAIFVVEHCVIEIEGCAKDDYHNEPWFSAFYRCANRWYEDRYGDLSDNGFSKHIGAAVIIYDRWFLLEIPTTFRGPVQPDKTVWIYLPTKVRDEEKPLDWFDRGPNISRMGGSATDRATVRIEKVVGFVRKINLNLCAPFSEVSQADIAQHIRSHIFASASHLSENTNHGAQLAIWEILFATEKSFKLWLAQRGVVFDDTHNLLVLNTAITVENASPLVEEAIIKKLPSNTEAIKFRYAELSAPSMERQREIYELSLSCIRAVTDALQRKYQFFDTGFQLKQPPWQKYEA